MSRETNQPNPTLYVNNIESKIKKIELRKQLYALFTPYGKVIDIIAKKGNKDRGQAFVVFEEQASATAALRALIGEEFYGRALRIDYAKTPSTATLRLKDPSMDDPSSNYNKAKKNQIVTASRAEQEYEELEKERQEEEEGKGKREREGVDGEEEGGGKRRKVDQDDDEEMEMDEDEDDATPVAAASSGPNVPTILLASNLPQEATQEALANLFEQYAGYQSITLLPTGSTPTRSASIVYSSLQQATIAQNSLDGFKLKPEWSMSVVVVPADAL